MRQIWIPRIGGPEVLELRTAPDPEPGEGQVRVRVRAAGVNFADTMARVGFYRDAPPLPFVPGYEVAGTIDAVGGGVPAARLGERVLAMTRFGGYSDVVCTPSALATPLPERLSFAQGAAIPVNWLTAWHVLMELGHLRAGQRVLIQAAAGGVGTAAVQIARHAGAQTIGTASAGKHARLKELGLDHAIDYRAEDFEPAVARLTGGKGVDLALDAVGGASFRKSLRCLKPTGKLMMYGASAVSPGEKRSLASALKTLLQMPRFGAVELMTSNLGVFGVNLGALWEERELLARHLGELLAGFERGTFQAIVDVEVPFDRAREAHARLAARENFGKVVLVP